MSADLTALRWQLIRTVEASQELEKENISLRKKRKADEEALEKLSRKQQENNKRVVHGVQAMVKGLREDLGEARREYFADLEGMKKGFKEVLGQLHQMALKNNEFRLKNDKANELNESLMRRLEKATLNSDKKAGQLSDEISRLKKELAESNAQHAHALSIIENKDFELRKSQAKAEELQKQIKISEQSNSKLAAQVKHLENRSGTELEELKKKNLDAEAAFNDKIHMLNMEMFHLRNEIETYKSEISRLTAKEGQKKTPFSQYVDLKTQNENLKAKVVNLKNIVRSVDPKHKSRAGHLLGMKNVDSVDSILAHESKPSRKTSPISPRPVPQQEKNQNGNLNDDDCDVSVLSLHPQPPERPLSIDCASIQTPQHFQLKLPPGKAAGQRPSQYRTQGSTSGREGISRSRPSSGTTQRPSRNISPIVPISKT